MNRVAPNAKPNPTSNSSTHKFLQPQLDSGTSGISMAANIRWTDVIVCGLLVAGANFSHGAEWSRFRGPNGSAFSEAQNLPVKWSDTENLAWKTDLPGHGSSSPIIWNDRIYITTYSGYGMSSQDPGDKKDLKRQLICLSLADGEKLWESEVPSDNPEESFSGFIREHGYSTSTPVCDGERIYVFFGKTGVLAFDLEGKQHWKTNVGTGSAMNNWGSGASPVLYENLVIVNAAAESKALIALDKSTGKVAWKSPADNIYGSWSTPILVDLPDGKTELVLSIPYEIWAFNPTDGEFRWFAEGLEDRVMCGSLVTSQGIVYAVGGRSGSAVAVKAGGVDDVTKTNTLWKKKVTAYVPSPVLAGDRIYSVTERGVLTCLNVADGETIFQKRIPDSGGIYASPVFADGKLYIVTRTNGTFVVSAEGEVLSQNQFSDETDFNASPAVVEGKILLRSNEALYCVGK